uniref:SOSEKI DIX-like domain-containing protein n=1 Tax=Arundo donax TaxID=35708 RepID=A0A0A9CW32_ARUDO
MPADVIRRLDVLRGKGMAAMYSWSCKRRYKTGFVWHDVSGDDILLPAQGSEYVLKGSLLLLRHSPQPAAAGRYSAFPFRQLLPPS